MMVQGRNTLAELHQSVGKKDIYKWGGSFEPPVLLFFHHEQSINLNVSAVWSHSRRRLCSLPFAYLCTLISSLLDSNHTACAVEFLKLDHRLRFGSSLFRPVSAYIPCTYLGQLTETALPRDAMPNRAISAVTRAPGMMMGITLPVFDPQSNLKFGC